MRMKSLQSGSNGNSIYIGSENTHLLVDAGISCKRITTELNEAGIAPSDLSGILVTHEHSDHTSGLKILSKHYHIPIYGTAGTLEAIRVTDKAHEIDSSLYCTFGAGDSFLIGDIEVGTISVSHDAKDPTAYRFSNNGRKAAVMTDLGTYTEAIVEFLHGLDAVLLESNHEIRMLESGSYPYALKRRILGDYGHLSNERSGELLDKILHDNLKHIFLGHLSEENNLPEIALMTVKNVIDGSKSAYHFSDFPIKVASRHHASETISF